MYVYMSSYGMYKINIDNNISTLFSASCENCPGGKYHKTTLCPMAQTTGKHNSRMKRIQLVVRE